MTWNKSKEAGGFLPDKHPQKLSRLMSNLAENPKCFPTLPNNSAFGSRFSFLQREEIDNYSSCSSSSTIRKATRLCRIYRKNCSLFIPSLHMIQRWVLQVSFRQSYKIPKKFHDHKKIPGFGEDCWKLILRTCMSKRQSLFKNLSQKTRVQLSSAENTATEFACWVRGVPATSLPIELVKNSLEFWPSSW